MPEETTTDGREDVEYPDLPNGWRWASGNVGSGYYTHWFETKYRMGGPLAGKHGMGGYSGEVYWDEGGEHHVHIYPITDASGDDPEVSERPAASGTFESKQEAVNAVPDMIADL